MDKKIRTLILVVSLFFLFAGIANANTVEVVNINTASATELAESINGVGMKIAQEIVRYREQHGPFKTVDELTNIKGIGPVTIDKNRQYLTIGNKAGKHAQK
ncbi:MAG TPA: helix-hairpin-helix domain-containing protein [Gammaproteobacteria bacterium]|nr:helix-hairpin-helix domain-containing protein [Gammaproteobacteria bacterium]